MNIIGLGAAGCNIAEMFEQYAQYDVYKLDADLPKKKGNFLLPVVNRVEEYETVPLNFRSFFKNLRTDAEVLFIVCGAGRVSGATLRVLEKLQKCKINILYIKPDLNLLSNEARLHERVVRGVLQEYARSGVFERTYIVDNKEVEKILDNVPVIGYYRRLNELIVGTIHMTNVFMHTKTVYNTPPTSLVTARVSTFGIVDIEKNEEKLFYPLDNINERCYIYAINKEQLETDGKLFTTLRERSANMVGDETIVSVRIHSTDYTDNYGYLIANTSETQQEH
jgi:hypothetical protein